MEDFLGLIVRIVADIYLMALALHLVLDPRLFHLNPWLARIHLACEPLLAPLRRALGRPACAVLVAMLLIAVAKGVALGFLAPSLLVFSRASLAMAAVIGVVPVLTPVCMSLLFLVDWTFVLLVISLAVSFLIEPYTVNPISRFAFQLVDFGERALGPLAERIEASWLKRLAVGAAAVILDAAVAAGLLVLLAWVSGSAPTDLGAFGVGLRSALSLAVEYGFWFFILVVIIGALMSWFSPDPQNPLVRFVSAVSYPLIAPFRRYIPPIAGIDISPIFVILLLGAAQSVLLRLIWRMF